MGLSSNHGSPQPSFSAVFSFFLKRFYLFYVCQHGALGAAHRPSAVAANRDLSLAAVHGLLMVVGFSCRRAQAQ